MMRRKASEINPVFMTRPLVKKSHMPVGIKHHRMEQRIARGMLCNAMLRRELVMFAKSQGVTVGNRR
jgi:hypothetical protein